MQAGAVALITGAALLIGGLLWSGLAFWHGKHPLTARSLFAVMLASGILCRLAYVFLTPIFYAPDEQSHFNYIKYLSEKKSFPILTKGMGDPANEWEYHQPPLYYLALVPVYRFADAMFHHPATTVVALRLCSFGLWLLHIGLGLVSLRRLEIKEDLQWLCALAFGCLLPTYTFVSSAINNDNLLTTMGAGVLCFLACRKPSLKTSLALGALLGLSLWVKASGVVLFPAVGLMLIFQGFQGTIPRRAALMHLGLVFGLAALIYSPWAARNWRIYGSFMPEGLSVATKTWPSMVDGLISAAHNLTKTFWSVSGISNDIGYPFPLFGMGFALFAFAGLAIGWKQAPRPVRDWMNSPNALITAALALAVLINLVLVLRLGYFYGMGQGRHLFALLYPIALLLAVGLRFVPARNPAIHLAGFWITYALAFQAFSLSQFPR